MTTTPDDPAMPAPEAEIALNEVSRRGVLEFTVAAAAITAFTPVPQLVSGAEAQTASPMAPVKVPVGMTINGKATDLIVDSRQSLLDVLRETLNLTGTKKGCNQGACGACTVLVNGKRITACLTLASLYDGSEITTIEGLAQGDQLHPMQQAFIKHEGFQCGYCTPGQIMSGVACIAEGHARSPEEIKFWMSGNICRCGAYAGIVSAVSEAAGKV